MLKIFVNWQELMVLVIFFHKKFVKFWMITNPTIFEKLIILEKINMELLLGYIHLISLYYL